MKDQIQSMKSHSILTHDMSLHLSPLGGYLASECINTLLQSLGFNCICQKCKQLGSTPIMKLQMTLSIVKVSITRHSMLSSTYVEHDQSSLTTFSIQTAPPSSHGIQNPKFGTYGRTIMTRLAEWPSVLHLLVNDTTFVCFYTLSKVLPLLKTWKVIMARYSLRSWLL